MAASDSSRGAFPFNVTTVMALLTLVGSLFMISKPLTSSRPQGEVEALVDQLGEQKVDVRLWEDPFKFRTRSEDPKNHPNSGNLGPTDLQEQIGSRQHGSTTNAGKLWLLAVMVPDGFYTEDRETRVRSRYAVVSALGVEGYAPDDNEHIGSVELPWPTVSEFRSKSLINSLTHDASNGTSWDNADSLCSGHLHVSFEWYHPRTFAPPDTNRVGHVLVLWLPEQKFENLPQVRLGWLLKSLVARSNRTSKVATGSATNIVTGVTTTIATNAITGTGAIITSVITTVATSVTTNVAVGAGTNFAGNIQTDGGIRLTNVFCKTALIGPRTSTTLRNLLTP